MDEALEEDEPNEVEEDVGTRRAHGAEEVKGAGTAGGAAAEARAVTIAAAAPLPSPDSEGYVRLPASLLGRGGRVHALGRLATTSLKEGVCAAAPSALPCQVTRPASKHAPP